MNRLKKLFIKRKVIKSQFPPISKNRKHNFSVAKQIEEAIKANPELEHMFIKLPGENIVEVSKNKKVDKVYWDYKKVLKYRGEYIKEYNLSKEKSHKMFNRSISIIHTHNISKTNSYILPSPDDIIFNIKNQLIKSGVLKEVIYCVENRPIQKNKHKVIGRIICRLDMKNITDAQHDNLILFCELHAAEKNLVYPPKINFLRNYLTKTDKNYRQYELDLLDKMKSKRTTIDEKMNFISKTYYCESIEKIYADMGINIRIDYSKDYVFDRNNGTLKYRGK